MKTNKTYIVIASSQYKKSYKRMAKRGLDMRVLDDAVHKLSCGEKLDKRYKDHVLKGRYKGFHECHILPDWLLIYSIENDTLVVTLVNTGTHSDLFDM